MQLVLWQIYVYGHASSGFNDVCSYICYNIWIDSFINCLCRSIRSMFRVLEIYNFDTYVNIQDLATLYQEPNDKMLRWIWPLQYILGT